MADFMSDPYSREFYALLKQDSNHITYAEAVLQNPAGPVLPTLVSVRQYAPCLVDSVAHVLVLSSTSLTPAIFPCPLLQNPAGSV